jgi:hypothetical protein
MKKSEIEVPQLWLKMQASFNAKKADFIMTLKDRGSYIGLCDKRGFIYSISLFKESMIVHVALKNGSIEVIDVIPIQNIKAV